MSWTHIILHCSDLPWGTAKGIDRHHRKPRDEGGPGFRKIGYHYVIHNSRPTRRRTEPWRDGLLAAGRTLEEAGAHARGWNRKAIGVCLIGKTEFSDAQFDAAWTLCIELMQRFAIPVENVLGHYEVTNSKTCPNFEMGQFRAVLQSEFLNDNSG